MSFLINNPKSDGLAGCYMQEIVNNIQARIVKAVHIMEGLLGARLSALLGAWAVRGETRFYGSEGERRRRLRLTTLIQPPAGGQDEWHNQIEIVWHVSLDRADKSLSKKIWTKSN